MRVAILLVRGRKLHYGDIMQPFTSTTDIQSAGMRGISDASEPQSGVVERLERLSDLDQIRVRFRIWMLCDEEAAVATIALVW